MPANHSYLAHCRQAIPGDRLPVAGVGDTVRSFLFHFNS